MESPPPSSSTSHRHRHSRRSPWRRALGRLWSEWWVEILIVFLLGIGTFLVVEKVPIRKTVLSWLLWATQSFQHAAHQVVRRLVDLATKSSLADLIGYALLAAAVGFVVWRIRWRLVTMPRFRARECPRCGGGLHRIHRRSLDRPLAFFVPVRRYRCRNSECGWQGLRVGRTPLE